MERKHKQKKKKKNQQLRGVSDNESKGWGKGRKKRPNASPIGNQVFKKTPWK